MNLVLHQFKKDVRQFRVFLGIWFGLLAIDLAVNLGWIGQAIYTPERGFDSASNTWTGILPIVLWAFVGVLPSLVVLADSPARRDGFLATRPLPKRDLLFAKILFVLALIVAPWVLSELVHLTGRGMPSWVWMRGTLERLMFTLPVALGCGAFAALWPDVARWVRAIAGLFAGYALIGITVSAATILFHLKLFDYSSHQAPAVIYAYALMLAAIGFAVWHSRAQRGVLARWGGLLATLFVSQWLASWLPWDLFQPAPENLATANSVLAQSGFEIPSRAVTLQREQDAEKDDAPQFNLGVAPKLKTVPPDGVVEWSGKNTKLARASGGELHGEGGTIHSPLSARNRWGFDYSEDDLKAWASQFPEDILFRQNNYNNSMTAFRQRLYLAKFNVPASRAEMTGPLTLSVELEARVFQWRIIADLPLTPGARTNTAFGSLQFIYGESNRQRPVAEIGFLRQQIELSTVADLRCSTAFGGPLSRMAYMVYDPQTHTTWLPDSYSVVTSARAPHTALPEYFTYLSFTGRKPFTAAELARCRLVAFEKSWLGSVPENITAPAFTLDDKLPENSGNVSGSHEPMARSEFIRRVDALKVPAPDATRSEVSLYLMEFLRLVDVNRRLDIGEPYVTTIAKFVPNHLDLLLGGLPAMGGNSGQLVLHALAQGATESQKPDLIAALPHQPQLAEVLLARDWVAEARPEIYQLLKSDRPLPLSAMRAVASFRDAETYPRLLTEFEALPSEAEDELLHNLGLDAQLEPIIARQWRDTKLATSPNSMFGTSFRLAMLHGDPSTLERVYRMIVADEEPERRMRELSVAYFLGPLIQMPDIKSNDRQKNEVVLAWLQKHRPENFVFNPARRQFVLKENLSTNATAGVSAGGSR